MRVPAGPAVAARGPRRAAPLAARVRSHVAARGPRPPHVRTDAAGWRGQEPRAGWGWSLGLKAAQGSGEPSGAGSEVRSLMTLKSHRLSGGCVRERSFDGEKPFALEEMAWRRVRWCGVQAVAKEQWRTDFGRVVLGQSSPRPLGIAARNAESPTEAWRGHESSRPFYGSPRARTFCRSLAHPRQGASAGVIAFRIGMLALADAIGNVPPSTPGWPDSSAWRKYELSLIHI